MKIVIQLIIAIGVLFSVKLKAQNVPDVNNQNHPTVSSVKVKYKAIPQGTVAPGANPLVEAIPEGLIILKPNVYVAKVYLKIVTTTSNTILYQVNYQTNSSVVTNDQGKKLFQNSNGTIFISNGQALTLKPYNYKVQTEDSLGNLSPVYSVFQ
jgi:hypothetical protein